MTDTAELSEIEFAISNEERYPSAEIRDLDIWLVWAYDNEGRKVPRAPWLTDTCYPVSWGADANARPETTFEEALKWSRFKGWELADNWPFPEDQEDTNLKLGMLLPHDPPEPPIMQVDLDDVRDPETGEINEFAREIIQRLAPAYTMVSTSGTGIHIYVRSALPERMGKFIEDLDPEDASVGQLELYDHGRFAAITGKWIEGTGTEIPERQTEINELIERFSSEADPLAEPERSELDLDEIRRNNESDNGDRSPYYSEPVASVAEPEFPKPRGEEIEGAHPKHGGTKSDDRDSTNFGINTRKNVWSCFAHESGGGPLSLVAMMENVIDCPDCGGKHSSALERLSDQEFAKVCLLARDRYGFSGDPPYRAMLGVSRAMGLAMIDEEEGIMGRDCYKIARQIYDSMRPADIE